MSNLMQGTSFHDEGDARFETNEHVRTVEVAKPATDWTSGALKSRRWNVTGRIYAHHDSHGVTYEVRHDDDGSIGHYEPRELRSVSFPDGNKEVQPCTNPEPCALHPRVTAPAKPEWEEINFTTARLAVPGGWLYRTRSYKALTRYENFPNEYAVTSESTTFVPDPLPVTIVP